MNGSLNYIYSKDDGCDLMSGWCGPVTIARWNEGAKRDGDEDGMDEMRQWADIMSVRGESKSGGDRNKGKGPHTFYGLAIA